MKLIAQKLETMKENIEKMEELLKASSIQLKLKKNEISCNGVSRKRRQGMLLE